MPNSKLILYGFLHSLGVVIYVFWVVIVMNQANSLFGQMDDLWGPIAMLLLFTVSAAICGLLVFGKPVLLFLKGEKTASVKLTLYTVGLLFLETAFIFAGLAIFQ